MPTNFKKIVLIGAGGVGFYTALALARDSRSVPVEVWDDDNFEGGYGASRLPKVNDPKTPKINFLQTFTKYVMGDTPPAIKFQKLEASNVDEMIGDLSPEEILCVDASDMSLATRRPIWDALRARGVRMFRISYDGQDGGIVVLANGLPLVTAPAGGYAQIPSLALSQWAGGLGASAIHQILEGKQVADAQYQLKFHEVSGNV